MTQGHLLSLITFLPLLGVVLLFLVPLGGGDKANTRMRLLALGTSCATFVLSLLLFTGFDPALEGFQFVEKETWIPSFGISYHRGVDGISLWFVLLSTLLTPIAIVSGFAIKEKVRLFMAAILVLETMMIGAFSSLDLVLFYVFFEGVLIPMFLMIGIWGGEKRLYAAMKFFLYTLLGSVLMLVAIFSMIVSAGTSDMTMLIGHSFPKEIGLWLFVAFFASFAVKTPMWPFHTWLPYAHVEAPTAGSVLLAGVLLKLGGYGFLRLCLQMLPEASLTFAPVMIGLSLVAILYASLVAMAQTDMKKLIAYSSVAHMGYVTLGLFSGTIEGIEGAMMVMLSHGIVSAALFLCVGVVYERLHTREIACFGGVASVMPRYASVMMVFTLAAVGLPGTSGFIGEFLTMLGAWQVHGAVAAIAALGVILGAAYMLWLYRRVFFGEAVKADVIGMRDLSLREAAMFAPLLILVVWVGFYPAVVRSVFAPSLHRVEERLHPRAFAEGEGELSRSYASVREETP